MAPVFLVGEVIGRDRNRTSMLLSLTLMLESANLQMLEVFLETFTDVRWKIYLKITNLLVWDESVLHLEGDNC